MSNRKIVWNKKALLFLPLLWLFPIAELLSKSYGIGPLGSYDEVIVMIGTMVVAWNFFKIWRYSYFRVIICCLFGVVLIGVLSNIYCWVSVGAFDIMIDILTFIKRWIVFFFFFLVPDKAKREIITRSKNISRFVIILIFSMSLITQIIPSFGTGETLSFLKAYGFIWENGAQTLWLISGSMLLLLHNDSKKNDKLLIMWAVISFLTLKTTSWCAIMLYYGIYILIRNKRKIKTGHLVVLGILLLVCAYSAIRTYFIDDVNSPRLVLILFGFITANTFFPLGAGFGTYGSAVANKLYSPLYIRYGFRKSYALSNLEGGGTVLNDNYLGMLAGQFGYIGIFLTLLMLICFFLYLNNEKFNSTREKAFALSTYFTILTTMVASATSNSSMGVWVMAVLGIVCSNENRGKTSTVLER